VPVTRRQRESIIQQQITWAESVGIEVDAADQVSCVAENLFAPLCAETRAELESSSARPFGDGIKPGPLQRLHDPTAMRCNFFDYWRKLGVLPPGLLQESVTGTLRQAVHLGAEGARADASREIDCLVEAESTPATAITTRFIDADLGDAIRLEPSFIDRLDGLVSPTSLRSVRLFAEDLLANPRRFCVTPVGRLLEQAAALCARYGARGYQIVHIWHEAPGEHGRLQHREFAQLRTRIGGDVELHGMTWQALFARIMERNDTHRGYTDYIASRYFGGRDKLAG
jgi:hypothetical protein